MSAGGSNRYQTGGLQHLTACLIRGVVGEDIFDAYLTFAIVRNPFDKLVSQYALMMERRPDLRARLGLDDTATFDEYVRALAQGPEHVQWMAQHRFVYDGSALIVDRLLRFERYAQDVGKLLDELGRRAPLPHVHASSHREYRSYYARQTRLLAQRLYAHDVERFGYAF